MDMVCEKNESTIHDFSKDPLKLKIEEINNEKWLTAEGTTLGADNGVGICYLLTLMKKIHKGELNMNSLGLDLLFTIDEEQGLRGAFKIEKDYLEILKECHDKMKSFEGVNFSIQDFQSDEDYIKNIELINLFRKYSILDSFILGGKGFSSLKKVSKD